MELRNKEGVETMKQVLIPRDVEEMATPAVDAAFAE
jgi:hypothetical protein